MYSIQRRYDRYRCIYIRKCIMGLVPKNGIEIEHDSDHRNGTRILVPSLKGMSALKLNSFNIRGAFVFNSLPNESRDMTLSMKVFKSRLDDFLALI